MDSHIIELLGKTRVHVVNQEVVSVETPKLDYCPLFNKKRNLNRITEEEIIKNLNFRIEQFGFFTNHRILDDVDDFLSFGVSEVLSSALNSNLIDSTITVCDGAGCVLTSNPRLVQGIGGHMSGLLKTTPIKETIQAIENRNGNVIDKKNASINMIKSLKKAFELGYQNIAVTIIDTKTAKEIRKLEAEFNSKINNQKVNVIIIAVHTSGISSIEAIEMSNIVDIATLCASKHLRDPRLKSIFQVGLSVPLVAFTKYGKLLLVERIKYINSPIIATKSSLPFILKQKQPQILF